MGVGEARTLQLTPCIGWRGAVVVSGGQAIRLPGSSLRARTQLSQHVNGRRVCLSACVHDLIFVGITTPPMMINP